MKMQTWFVAFTQYRKIETDPLPAAEWNRHGKLHAHCRGELREQSLNEDWKPWAFGQCRDKSYVDFERIIEERNIPHPLDEVFLAEKIVSSTKIVEP